MDEALSATLFKLLGLAAIMLAITMLPNVLGVVLISDYESEYFTLDIPLYVALTTGPFLLLLGIAFWLLLRGRRRSPDAPADERPRVGASTAQVTTSLLLAAGVLLVGFSLMGMMPLASEIVFLSMRGEETFQGFRPALVIWGSLAGHLVPLVLGLLLVFKTSTITTLLRRQWNRARPEAADAQCPHCGSWIVTSDYRQGAVGYRCDNCKQGLPRELLEGAAPRPSEAS